LLTGKPEATARRNHSRREAGQCRRVHREMARGYDTMIGERGSTLSGGQRQRITIARAIIRDSPILILDDPRPGLDAESEQLVSMLWKPDGR